MLAAAFSVGNVADADRANIQSNADVWKGFKQRGNQREPTYGDWKISRIASTSAGSKWRIVM
jgi:hypothetical protein